MLQTNQEAIHFFVDSTGPKVGGFYLSNFGHLKHRAVLSGWPHSVQQEIFENLRRQARQQGTPCELVFHPLDNTIQGILLPQLSTGAFGFDPDSPFVRGAEALRPQGDLTAYREAMKEARAAFQAARAVHNSQERIYLEHMDFSAADSLGDALVRRLLGHKSGTRPGREFHRFFGAATAEGNLDHIPQVTAGLDCRIFIKGRPGTGKSTLLKKVCAAALRRGCVSCYATEGVYPPTLEYLQEHYGVQIDRRRYKVYYEVFAENLMPNITVLAVK